MTSDRKGLAITVMASAVLTKKVPDALVSGTY
jgi:hypothetical protein